MAARPWLSVCAVLAFLAAWAFRGGQLRVLEVTHPGTGRIVLCSPMDEGEEFILSFVHSVNRRPVYDTLRIVGDHLVVVQSRYDSFGAGMPETSDGEGQLAWDADGWLIWTVNRSIPGLDLFVGRNARHSITIRGVERALADLVEPGSSVSIRSVTRSPVERWMRNCLE